MPHAHMPDQPSRRVLVLIVLAQWCGTSPWFAVNAVMPELQAAYGWPDAAVGTLSASLQLGFIGGTFVFALLALADRFDARRVFLICALAASVCTLASALMASSFEGLLAWRVLTGFFLAGIYPVGMKIASQWFPRGLGAALGWLVGALVLGSASAHALRAIAQMGSALPWQAVFVAVAVMAAAGGLVVALGIPSTARAAAPVGSALHRSALASVWREPRLRASVFGYFGHMWELYTLWVLLPAILATRISSSIAVSWWAFAVLGAGAFGCVMGGLLTQRVGSARVAAAQLATSGVLCLTSPWLLQAPMAWFLVGMMLWGITVVGDSPQFSALTAANAPREAVGSLLTLVNSIGFAISALSIECFVRLAAVWPLSQVLPWLAIGPMLGLIALRPLVRTGR